MTVPAIPDWVPWWGPILVLVFVLLWALAFLFMPFAVFGVKGRLEAIEARLDEIQGEIRSLALRMPEPVHHTKYDEALYAPPATSIAGAGRRDTLAARPPIPPAAPRPDLDGRADQGRGWRRPDPARATSRDHAEPRTEPRAEPRLDWPR